MEMLHRALSTNRLATRAHEVGAAIIPIFLMRIQSFEVRCLAQDHTPCEWQTIEFNISSV